MRIGLDKRETSEKKKMRFEGTHQLYELQSHRHQVKTHVEYVRNKKYPAFLVKGERHMAITSLELSDKPFTWLAPNSM